MIHFFNIRLIFIYIYNVLTKIWQNEKLLWTSFKLVLFYTLATFTHPKLTFWRIMHHFVCIHSKCNTNFDILIYRIPWIRQIWCTYSTRFLFQEFFSFGMLVWIFVWMSWSDYFIWSLLIIQQIWSNALDHNQ